MRPFEYVRPESLEAVSARLLEGRSALPIAGGMDLLGLMKNEVARPERLVSLKGVAGHDGIERIEQGDWAGGTRIGALTSLSELIAHPGLGSSYPALVSAAITVGTPQIRNRGTLGGNLCQRPRCWYFRSDLFDCLKKGGGACFAQGGDNRYHAIFGNHRCAIVHPSSCAPALVAYGARINLHGPNGPRSVGVADFFVAPEANIRTEVAVGPGETVTSVELPSLAGWHSATSVVKHKQSHDWPLAIASVALQVRAGTIEAARVVMGAVAPVPWRSPAAERVLVGAAGSEPTARAAGEAAVADADPMEHNGYKVRVAAAAVKRAVMAALDGGGAR